MTLQYVSKSFRLNLHILCPGWFGFMGPLPGCCGPPAPGRPTGATIIPCGPDGTGCWTMGCNITQ